MWDIPLLRADMSEPDQAIRVNHEYAWSLAEREGACWNPVEVKDLPLGVW